MKERFKYVLIGVVTFIVTSASFFISANACGYMLNETKVPKCLK